MSAALMEIGGPKRQYLFFDSFEGLPPAEDIDGYAANVWQANSGSSFYYDNCAASIEEFNATIRAVSAPADRIEVHKGFFSETFSDIAPPPIAILRLDADWYSSTMECLTKFWSSVLPGGLVLIDDYGTWDGCTKAVHDFLSLAKSPAPIRRGRLASVAYLHKEMVPDSSPVCPTENHATTKAHDRHKLEMDRTSIPS
jgi:hypothetical protein